MIRLAAVGGGRAFIDLAAPQADVIGAVQGQRIGGRAIAPGAADFLIIAFDGFGQVGMGDPADVRLVDAHSKGNRCHHDQAVFLLKAHFHPPAVLSLHPAVIETGRMTRLAQRLGQGFGLGAGGRIDDARLPFAGSGKGQDLLAGRLFDLKGQAQVGPVEPAQKGGGGDAIEQARHDFGPGFLVRRGGKGGKRHVQRAAQRADPQIVGAKVVAPLADAMRLVHGNQTGANATQHLHGCGRGQTFRCHVKQLDAAFVQALKNRLRLFPGIARSQGPGHDARRPQGPHLIAHQGDQRRDDHRHPIPAKRRKLEAQRLAAPRRHDRQNVLSRQNRLNDLGLTGAEPGKAEDGLKQGKGIGHGTVHRKDARSNRQASGAAGGHMNIAALLVSTIRMA